MKKSILLLAMLAACGSKSDKSADNAGGGGDACTVAATKAVDLSMGARLKRLESRGSAGSDMSDVKAKLEEQATKFKGVMAKRCTDDKWSQDVIDCYTNAASRDVLMSCRTKMTPDQQAALQKEEQALRGGRMGMGGGGMGGGGFHRRDGSGGAGEGSSGGETGSGAAPAMGSGSSAAPAAGSASPK